MKTWCGIFLLLVMGCSSGRVITYAHPNANFDAYRTYSIESHEKIAEVSAEGYATYQRLDQVIAQALEAKGYRYHLESDLIVSYKVSSGLGQNNRNDYYDRYSWYSYDYNYRDRRQPMEGQIEIILKDRPSKKTAWTGSADLVLKGRGTDNEMKIKLKIQEIFDRFTYTAAAH